MGFENFEFYHVFKEESKGKNDEKTKSISIACYYCNGSFHVFREPLYGKGSGRRDCVL
jgi:hypothetical protein